MQIQVSWLLQKPTDLDLHCLQRQVISGFSRTRVNIFSSIDKEMRKVSRAAVEVIQKKNQQTNLISPQSVCFDVIKKINTYTLCFCSEIIELYAVLVAR